MADVQEIIFRQAWEGKTYPDIAESCGYDANYIKDVGSKLWKLLSQAFGEEVTKSNFRSVLRRRCPRQALPMQNSVIIRKSTKSASNLETVSANKHRERWDISIFFGDRKAR